MKKIKPNPMHMIPFKDCVCGNKKLHKQTKTLWDRFGILDSQKRLFDTAIDALDKLGTLGAEVWVLKGRLETKLGTVEKEIKFLREPCQKALQNHLDITSAKRKGLKNVSPN